MTWQQMKSQRRTSRRGPRPTRTAQKIGQSEEKATDFDQSMWINLPGPFTRKICIRDEGSSSQPRECKPAFFTLFAEEDRFYFRKGEIYYNCCCGWKGPQNEPGRKSNRCPDTPATIKMQTGQRNENYGCRGKWRLRMCSDRLLRTYKKDPMSLFEKVYVKKGLVLRSTYWFS